MISYSIMEVKISHNILLSSASCSDVKNFEARSTVLFEVQRIPSSIRTRQKSANKSLEAKDREKLRKLGLPSKWRNSSIRKATMANSIHRDFWKSLAEPRFSKPYSMHSSSIPLFSRSLLIFSKSAQKTRWSLFFKTGVKAGRSQLWIAIFESEKVLFFCFTPNYRHLF